jgi:putative endonuclease
VPLCYVYMVQCADGTLYTGWTNSLPRRLKAHNAGRGAKYTRSRRPVCLVWAEQLPSPSDALRREAAIKRLSRAQKLALITALPPNWQESIEKEEPQHGR